MTIIEVKNLSYTYEYHKKEPGIFGSLKNLFKRERHYIEAVKDISFEIKKGELVGFLGPNGAGKTTALKILSGILYPAIGQVKVLDYIPWQRKKEYQKQFSLVMGQKNQLWWDLPAMESFLLNKAIYEIDAQIFNQTLEELAELLEVKDLLNIQVRKLSLGQRMKCELIAALLHRPKVLFLDEPTIGLDVVSQRKIRDFIKDYNQKYETTIILTSHYMEDIKALARRVLIIDLGKIIYDGGFQDLIDKYIDYKLIKIIFEEPIKKESFSGLGEIEVFNDEMVVLKVKNEKCPQVASEILSTMPVDDILIEEVEAEEVVRQIFTALPEKDHNLV